MRQTQNPTKEKQEKDKTNIVNKVKNSFFGAAAPAQSQEDQAEFKRPATKNGQLRPFNKEK
jgi:hypothetical protein